MLQADFATELSRLRPTLLSLTRRFTHDKEESADLVQETLLRALTYRDKFVRNVNLHGWLFTMMRNIYINNFRKAQHAQTHHDNSKDLYKLNIADDVTFHRPEAYVSVKEIWKEIDSIPPELQTPFKMHLTGYRYEEIAAQLKIPLGTVKNRIFHARKEIQKKLTGYR